MVLDVNRPWRMVKVTERRARRGLRRLHARSYRYHYPDAERIRVVLDNL